MKKNSVIILMLILICIYALAGAESWTCSNCGRESEGNYCSWCGTKRALPPVVCPVCHTEFDPEAGYLFCNNCGSPLREQSPSGINDQPVEKTISFGCYEQDGNPDNGPEPVEWIVLDIQDDKALVISKYGLDAMPYNTESTEIVWEKSTLRAWLNNDFLNTAFSLEEQSSILNTVVDNSAGQGYSEWSTFGGNNTEDQIFLLSYYEANQYLGVSWENKDNHQSRISPTAYAVQNGAWSQKRTLPGNEASTGWWWLRSPGNSQSRAAYVDSTGSFFNNEVSDEHGCIRPAFWLKLESGAF